jgi:hypothetical protein
MSCVSDGDSTVWTEHIEQHPTPIPAEGISDEPYRLWASAGGEAARLVHLGYISTLPPLLVGKYLVWATLDDAPVFADLSHSGAPRERDSEELAQAPLGDDHAIVLIERGSHDVRVARVFRLQHP